FSPEPKGWKESAGRVSVAPLPAGGLAVGPYHDVVTGRLEANANLSGGGHAEHRGWLETGKQQAVADLIHHLAAHLAVRTGVIGDLTVLVDGEQHFHLFAGEAERRCVDHGAFGVKPVEADVRARVGGPDGEGRR